MRLKELLKNKLSRELVLYILFGVGTTFISILVYKVCNDLFCMHHLLSNIVSWVLAVLFAYVTNRRYVFESRAQGKAIIKEIVLFYGARLLSLGMEEIGLLALIDGLLVNKDIAKIITSFAVIILNYVLSKLVVFRQKNKTE